MADPDAKAAREEFDRILDAVLHRIDREEVVRLTQELVRIPSVYRPDEAGGNEERAAEFVAGYLGRAGFEVQTEEVTPGRPNVWAVWEGDRPGKTLLFEAHTDVVTEGRAGDWSYPPFAAERAVGRIYGRGACDTKGNLAAAVVAVRAIKDSGVPFPGRIILCHPVDEEGMMAGIKHFIERGHADGVDGAIICEPEENQLCVKQKGAMRVEVTVRGKMAHGAMPLSGVNPVTRAARFVVAVEEMEREEMERHGEDPMLGYPSLTPTIMLGPEAGEPQINVIPASAYVALDIRTVPDQSHEEIVERLKAILSKLEAEDPDFDAEPEVIEERPPTETPADDPLVLAMAKAHEHLTREEPRYNGVPGATDGTFLRAWAGIPIVTTGAGGREVPHHVDEWVGEEELYAAARLYAATAMYYCYGRKLVFDYRSMFDLTGKSALVVGAGSGIGEAGAHGLAAFGARVFCADVDVGAAEDTAGAIGEEDGEAEVLELDMLDAVSVRSAVEQAGTPDVLVCTPSINVRKPLLEMADEEFDRVVRLNLEGTFRLVREFGRGMAERGSGSIIAFASIRAQVVEPGQGVYAATKAGTVQMLRALAAELGPRGVRVNAIAPGVVETPLTEQIKDSPDWYDAYAQKTVLGRWAQPHEMVGMIVYLASDAGSYVTGSLMLVDGGWTAADGRFTPPL